MAKGALIAILDFSTVDEDEFNAWYDTEHIPERLRVPGFLSAQRWLAVDDARLSLVLYDLSDISVLSSPAYEAIAGANLSPWSKRIIAKCKSFRRLEAVQMVPGDELSPAGAAALLFVGMNVDPAIEEEFNRWYNEEHLPRLLAVPGVLSARRYRSVRGDLKYLAIYHLATAEVVDRSEWRDAAKTPCALRIRPYTRDRTRILCRPYQPST